MMRGKRRGSVTGVLRAEGARDHGTLFLHAFWRLADAEHQHR